MTKKSLYLISSLFLYFALFLVTYFNIIPILKIDPSYWHQNIVALIITATIIFFSDYLLFFLIYSKKSWLHITIDYIILLISLGLMQLSSNIEAWLIIPASFLIIFFKNSFLWNIYLAKNSMNIKPVNISLLNENLIKYNKNCPKVYVNNNLHHESFIVSHNGENIIVLNTKDYEQNENYVTLLILRLLSISQTKNKIYGNNIAISIQCIVVIFTFYLFDFKIGSIISFLSYCSFIYIINILISIMLNYLENQFEVTYDIYLFDQNIDKEKFKEFISLKYDEHQIVNRLAHIEEVEESKFTPYNTHMILKQCEAGFTLID